jgi:hypothetical protein
MFRRDGCFLRAEDFSCSLDVLYRGLGLSKLKFLFKKLLLYYFFSCKCFSIFLVIKTLDPHPERIRILTRFCIDQNCWIRIRMETSADPQHCLFYIVDLWIDEPMICDRDRERSPLFFGVANSQ